MNFAKKCKELRIKKAVTQEQMATALNLSSQAISKWENGLTLPDITLLPEISVYFGVTIDELFDITENKHLSRIENMLVLQETIEDADFEYAQSFLLTQLAEQKNEECCLRLLPALYNHKAWEYRRKAEYYAKEALTRFPDSHSNHSNLNEAQQGLTGDWNLDNQAERIRYYKEFLLKNPDSKESWHWYITALLHAGRCDEAQEAILKLEKLSGGSATATDVKAANHLRTEIYHAQLLWAQGNHQESLSRFDKITSENPDAWLAWNFAGDAYAKACQYEKAIDCYTRTVAVQPKPRYTDAPMAIAQICEITGDTSRAIAAWEMYIRILNEDWNTTEGAYIDRANGKILELRNRTV